MHRNPVVLEWDGCKCYIAHGDGLGPGEYFYKFLKKIYKSRLCQWLFNLIHPDLGIAIARLFIKRKHFKTQGVSSGEGFISSEKEILHTYCTVEFARDNSINCFIMGHRHIPIDLEIQREDLENSRYINVGDWTKHFSWAVLESGKMSLHK